MINRNNWLKFPIDLYFYLIDKSSLFLNLLFDMETSFDEHGRVQCLLFQRVIQRPRDLLSWILPNHMRGNILSPLITIPASLHFPVAICLQWQTFWPVPSHIYLTFFPSYQIHSMRRYHQISNDFVLWISHSHVYCYVLSALIASNHQ